MTFQDFIGQEHVKNLLSDHIRDGRIGHAYIFCGPEGIGRKSMAYCFAEALTCKNGGILPCGSCESCVLNHSKTNPDIITIRQQEGKATIGVDEVRSVQEEVSTAPQYGKYKILIFEHAEKLTVQAQNALLKTLEEPPAFVVMILVTSNLSVMLDTVKSRSVRVDFQRNTDSEVLEAFTRAHGNIAVDRRILCEYADGIIGRALMMADFAWYDKVCGEILSCLSALPSGGGQALCAFENLFAAAQDQKEIYFFTLYSLLRDIAVLDRYGGSVPLQNTQVSDRIQELSRTLGYHRALGCMKQVDHAWKLIGQNVNYKLAVDALAIHIQEVIHGTSSRGAF